MNFEADFTTINVNYLVPGMEIDYEIYYKTPTAAGMEYVLLCKNVLLNEEMIKKFRRVTTPENIVYVPNKNYNETFKYAIEGTAHEKPSSRYKGYNEVKEEMTGIFSDVTSNQRISAEQADALSNTVHEQLNSYENAEIIQCINSLRSVDEYLHTHSVNVSLLNAIVGRWLKFDEENLDSLIKIGLLHDLGKLLIPPEILNKPAKLTPAEFAVIKQHPTYSYTLLIESNITNERILRGVVQHHEKVNGTGYPMGLSSDNIDEFARITSISDVYDAMVAKRVYKDAHSPFEILAWFAEGCYSDLDINYVHIFLESMVEELKGKKVLLSDNSIAEVLYVHNRDFEFPIVRQNGEIIHTSRERSCVRML